MSPFEDASRAARFATAPRLPCDESGPVFAEPWQAQAFALAVHLHAAGAFSWTEWSDALAHELRSRDAAGDDQDRYYEHWLAALERLVVARGVAAPDALAARKAAWEEAYRRTPHGRPVEL